MKKSEGPTPGIRNRHFCLLERLAGHLKVTWDTGEPILPSKELAKVFPVLCPLNASSACPVTVGAKVVLAAVAGVEVGQHSPLENRG